MNDLGLDVSKLLAWFAHAQDSPYALIQVSDEHAAAWAEVLGLPLRRCYIADAVLDIHAERTGRPKAELLAAKLPDRGSVMAGDFGEILVFLYHAALEHPQTVIGPKKWRLKQDRTKPAPCSDVVHFVVPSWPLASEQDRVLCSEVKLKSTARDSSPNALAVAGCEKDRISRLVKTLAWLRERALHEDLGTTTIDHIERFINAADHPPALKQFRAVAVVCSSLVNEELAKAPAVAPADYSVVIIAVPDLKDHYEAVFDAIHATVADPGEST